MTLWQKLTIDGRRTVLVAIVFLVVGIAFLFLPNPIRFIQEQQERACTEKCANIGRSGKLVSGHVAQPAKPISFGQKECKCF